MNPPVPHDRFPHLFAPLRLRGVTLRNRIVMLPMGSRFARDGAPTEGDLAFWGARAKGGVGMIITGGTAVHPNGAVRSRTRFEPFTPSALPGLARLADAVHADGSAIIAQLSHYGRINNGDSDFPTIGPSAVASPIPSDPQVPHAMSLSEVEDMIAAFATAARNFRHHAGFDGIEIHAAHGYLVSQFLSPQANRRDDRYGGSPEGRMRFLLDIIDVVRAGVGPDAVVGLRLSADEGDVEGAMGLPDSERIAKAAATTGKIDYISVTLGVHGAYVKDMSVRVGPTIPLAAAIRAASGVKVIAGQRINHPSLAETALASGSADLIGMARPLITDWEWAAKARDGRVEQIRPCIACNQVCRSGIMGCVHSPTAGRETLWGPGSLHKAAVPRRIVVVGGGPGGMEAAIQAAERGHDVVLFEAARHLGGQARIAALAPNRTDVDGVVSWRASELRRLGVRIRLGETAGADSILAERPDAVVLATGAAPASSDIDGADLPHVIDVVRVQEPDADTLLRLQAARHAVVLDDGSGFWETCSAAEALAARGIAVGLITPARAIAGGVPSETAGPLLRRLRAQGVTLLPMHRVAAIEPGRVLAYDAVRVAATQVLEENELPADIVVVFAGKTARDRLRADLFGKVPALHMVGDCVAPRRINHAVLEGHRVGRAL